MKLKPTHFIGHKLGPFEHIELTWSQNKDSRYTLIVGENGMGKTTLVTAMAACLSFGEEELFPPEHFERFITDEGSFSYLEVKWGNEYGWCFYWLPKSGKRFMNGEFDDIYTHISTMIAPVKLPDLEFGVLNSSSGIETVYTSNFYSLFNLREKEVEISMLTAAYGVNRDIKHTKIREYQDEDFDDLILVDFLNPFAPIQSPKIFQIVFNHLTSSAFAFLKGQEDEFKAYKTSVERIQEALKELGYPVSFEVNLNPLRLEVKHNGIALSIDQLSDGVRSFLSWSLDYLMRGSWLQWNNIKNSTIVPGLVIVDEIDSHLHPEWQRRIMPVLSKLLPQTYIIATTHSPFVLGSTDDAQIFKIEQDASGKLTAKSFDDLHGYRADVVLKKAFVSSLYAPEFEEKLTRLDDLIRKVEVGEISNEEKQEHHALLVELSESSVWLANFLALKQTIQGRKV